MSIITTPHLKVFFTLSAALISTAAAVADGPGTLPTRQDLIKMRAEIEELREQNRQLAQQLDTLQEQNAAMMERMDGMHTASAQPPPRPGSGDEISEDEIKWIVREVLEDSEIRPELPGRALTAGHDGTFYIGSADNEHRLEFAGHLQTRYTYNRRDNRGGDDSQAGFNIRRLKIKSGGWVTIADRKVAFKTSLVGDQDKGDPVILEDYYLEVPDFPIRGLSLRAGRYKQPFALQNITSSFRQLAVERATVHELFRVDRSEGLMLIAKSDTLQFMGVVNDGIQAEKTDFDQDASDIAFTARLQGRLLGNWNQLKDPATAWRGEPAGLFVGGALHYEVGETGTSGANDNFLLWTTDLNFEKDNLGIMTALYGHHTDNEISRNFDDYGLLVESGYFLVPDTFQPFLRYQWIHADDARAPVINGTMEENTHILTGGFNWYQLKHHAKFTLDFSYALNPIVNDAFGPGPDPDSFGSSSLGFRSDADGEDGQLVLRAQYQLLW